MNIFNRSMRCLAIPMFFTGLSQAQAAPPELPREGWASWQVDAVEGAPSWCCFSSWKEKDPARMVCKLDGSTDGYGVRDDDIKTDAVKVYARVKGGKLVSLQVFGASCPVESKTPIQDLGKVAADDSARWLIAQAKQDGKDMVAHRPIAEGALAALAMHRGDLASDALKTFARTGESIETRKWAIFWLAMVRSSDGADVDATINAALRKDVDEDVREQAIFALSRLPDERATKALIAVAEDQSLTHEQRKRAVFWLSQLESGAAQAYLEKVLALSATR
jgi:hypothetical protein